LVGCNTRGIGVFEEAIFVEAGHACKVDPSSGDSPLVKARAHLSHIHN
jgi:hypothetical protein